MSLDKLQKQIHDDATHRAEEVEGEARRLASGLLSEAKIKAKEIEETKRKELEEEIARLEAEQKANSELLEKNALLDARNHLVESLIPKLKSMTVKKAREKGYEALINDAIKEANEIAPQEDLILTINKNDAAYAKKFKGKINYGNVGNGVELQTKNGDIKITATIEGLFDKNRQMIETMLVEEAFPTLEKKLAPREKKMPIKKAPKKKAEGKAIKKKRK